MCRYRMMMNGDVKQRCLLSFPEHKWTSERSGECRSKRIINTRMQIL